MQKGGNLLWLGKERKMAKDNLEMYIGEDGVAHIYDDT